MTTDIVRVLVDQRMNRHLAAVNPHVSIDVACLTAASEFSNPIIAERVRKFARMCQTQRRSGVQMPKVLVLLFVAFLAACSALPQAADPASDAPKVYRYSAESLKDAASYQQALRVWHTPEDVNAWIGAKFTYDLARAMALSETQRAQSGQLSIYEPQEFFAAPLGVCVDLSRFAVETLRRIDPEARPNYFMIEFAPVELNGNTLRMHWLASFRRDGNYYFFADSKRPGYIAGPYLSTAEFIAEYAKYRGRQIVAYRELGSYQRTQRILQIKQGRGERP